MAEDLSDWTLLLLRPDSIASNYGQDTYSVCVPARTAHEALKVAREQAINDDKAWDVTSPEDYFCLFCAQGAVPNLAASDGTVVEP